MKHLYKYLIATLTGGLLLTSSCSDDTQDVVITPAGETLIDTQELTFGGTADEPEQTITFKAGDRWTATLDAGHWLTLSPTSGEAGDSRIHLNVTAENTNATQRRTQLSIWIDGETTPFIIPIKQESLHSELQIEGDVNEGIMTLTPDANGDFTGKLTITATRRWEVVTEGDDKQWLSFATDQQPQDGKKTTVTLTVYGTYPQFTSPTMSGRFIIKANGTDPVTIDVKASATCQVFETETATTGETERTAYELVDTITSGTFMTTFYVTSNIKWELSDIPEWLTTTKAIINNLNNDGTISNGRIPVTLTLHADSLSSAARTAQVVLKDRGGKALKTIDVTFSGVNANYIEHDFTFPAYDPLGGDFAFEARESYIDPDNMSDAWKKIELPFNIKTATNYTTLDEAPFHLIACKSQEGILKKEEVHWAVLRMGDSSLDTETGGIFTKQLYLRANDRPDADDESGMTNPTTIREAFIFIVPRHITFNDLFDGEQFKKEYEELQAHIMQKQDHNSDFEFVVDGLTNGQTLFLPAEGFNETYNILKTSSQLIFFEQYYLHKDQTTGTWKELPANESEMKKYNLTFSNDNGSTRFTLKADRNNTGVEVRYRFYIKAFRGDDHESTTVFQFDIVQAAN